MRGVLIVLLLAGCENVVPEPDFERMQTQASYRSYEGAPMFAASNEQRYS